MVFSKRLVILLAVFLLLLVPLTSNAANTLKQTKVEIEKAEEAALDAMKQGPAEIPFAGQAIFHLPKDFCYIPPAESKNLMDAMGNLVGDGFIGLIIPTRQKGSTWFVAATFNKSGYVKDDDAKNWKADELLNNIRSRTEEQNKTRNQHGLPEREILGWVEKPAYDPVTHRLVWSVASREKGEPDAEQGISYNTLALGREGYISLNLVADRCSLEGLKPVANTLLAGLEFNAGKRYADFNARTDRGAAYGLAEIVAGVAAKNLGIFAIFAAFIAKFAKVIGLVVAASCTGLLNNLTPSED